MKRLVFISWNGVYYMAQHLEVQKILSLWCGEIALSPSFPEATDVRQQFKGIQKVIWDDTALWNEMYSSEELENWRF